MPSDIEWVRIERTFDASIETVWEMWTDPERFAQWYGPNGARVPVADMDVVPGGRRRICMAMDMPERTMTMWFTGTYTEVDPPNRLVYTESLCDENGILVPPQSMGMPEGHPEITEVVIELTAVGRQTKMTLTHIGVPADSGGAGGWAQAIEKLTALL